MSTKQMKFDTDAHNAFKEGIEQMARAVSVTMGPSGRNVVVQKSFGSPAVTKDGVSVSREVELPQAFQNMGAQMVHQVAKKTADLAGDGTTTATVLANSVFKSGLRHVTAGANAVAIQRGINAAALDACEYIESLARSCAGKDDLRKIAMVSANHDAVIADVIAEALDTVGADGVVEVEEGKAYETTLDYVEGMAFDKGYLSPYFMTDPKSAECVLEDAVILLHEKKISNLADLLPLLNKTATAGKQLLIIAEDVENEALAALVVNRLRGVLQICAVKAPGFGERRKAMLGDIAAMTGGLFLSEDLGRNLEDVELEELGSAQRIVITKDSTTVIRGAGSSEDIDSRAAQIRMQIEKSTSDYDREKLQERLAKLTGGVAIIAVGGSSEVEMKERKDRVDDALSASRAAAKEGYVPGGGVSFIRAQKHLRSKAAAIGGDESIGYEILAQALEAPAWHIAENCGVDGDVVVDKIREGDGDFGYDAGHDVYGDMVERGIIDPALVVCVSMKNAASVSGLLLTTDVAITDLDGDDEPIQNAIV
jgi:chaperonin GroEL